LGFGIQERGFRPPGHRRAASKSTAREDGAGPEQREYERGPHDRGTREQFGLAALRPVVQRGWHSASQLL
jgi:hypothetical protein